MQLIKNIRAIYGIHPAGTQPLKGVEMSDAGEFADAYLIVDGERIHSWGKMAEMPSEDGFTRVIDARYGYVLPAFCDAHTHIIYAGSREGEFCDKIDGLSYEEIAARGGGILNSADLLHDTDEESLFASAHRRLRQVMAMGTGAIEIKSGYGLNTADELKMLRIIRRLREAEPQMEIRSTFLGAHAVGRAYTGRQSEYVEMLISEMLPAVAAEGLADFVDVFCDRGFFTPEETARILEAAAKYGIRPKIHANELAVSGGVQVGVKYGAVSVDHLERMGEEEIEVLMNSATIPTMLPGASFFLGMPYGRARDAVRTGLPVALASDYNPGSSPSGDMRFVWALGCIKMRLSPAEAMNAVTLNGAAAMDLAGAAGSITPGKFASLIITRQLPSLAYIPYAYTEPWIERVMLKGRDL
ncbi:MAG: imidazolonepropionase [Muribaculaceae bacterium]